MDYTFMLYNRAPSCGKHLGGLDGDVGEADLLAVFRHELAPLKALLGGKVRVRGDRAALMRFAPFL